MTKKLFISIIAMLFLVLGSLYASPYVALYQINTAAGAENVEKLSKYIDYASVRQSLTEQFNDTLSKKTIPNDNFSKLMTLLAGAMVDVMSSPKGLGLMLQGKDILLSDSKKNTAPPKAKKKKIKYSVSYQSFNHVNVLLFDKPKSKHYKLKIKMARNGLSWKIKGLEIPL